MSRTAIEVPMKTNNVDGVLHVFSTILESSGYEQKIVDGETVWAKGNGVITALQCCSATFTGNSVVIQGWFKDAITGESPLEGFVGALPKKKMRGLMEKIQTAIIANGL